MDLIDYDFLNAEHELDRARITLRAVLDSTLSVVFITDSDFKVIACSRAALEVWEMPEDQVIGQPFEKILSFLKFEGREFSAVMPGRLNFLTR